MVRGYCSVNIDSENHAHLTMACLSAVEPEGGGRRVDRDLELRDLVARSLHHLVTTIAGTIAVAIVGAGCGGEGRGGAAAAAAAAAAAG
jgi:hypothetical protein